jgi:hypothetical protein
MKAVQKTASEILVGRREGKFLSLPSVQRMTTILGERCREPSWVRTSVASLVRFSEMTGYDDLEALCEWSLKDPTIAERAVADFAHALQSYTATQISALAMGVKIWMRLNGIMVSWRPLPGKMEPATIAIPDQRSTDRIILLSLVGSGLSVAELLRLRIGDIGSLDAEGRLIPDKDADPLAVQFTPKRGKAVERITFLTYYAHQSLLSSFEERFGDGPISLDAPLLVQENAAGIRRARKHNQALIQAGSDANVALCRVTGDFFREWGLPGSRFEGADDLNIEEFI